MVVAPEGRLLAVNQQKSEKVMRRVGTSQKASRLRDPHQTSSRALMRPKERSAQ